MMPLTKLAILIPTIESRKEQFNALRDRINKLIESNFDTSVQLISICDNKEISIGAKRQQLLEASDARYVVFIDDDDRIHDDYITDILSAISHQPDFIGFQIECSGTPGITANVSNAYSDWADKVDGFDYVRTPYHKTPIKRDIALHIGFKDMRFGEDYDFSKRLKESGLIQKEYHIDKVLYFYQFKYENPKTKYGL
jgi:glycosyltransferase involved in cell wall biosynthesis